MRLTVGGNPDIKKMLQGMPVTVLLCMCSEPGSVFYFTLCKGRPMFPLSAYLLDVECGFRTACIFITNPLGSHLVVVLR